MSDVQIGTANYDARGGKEFNHFALENGPTQLYRVLPPLHNLAADGQWFIYKPSHWVEGSPRPGKDQGQKRQFVCPQKKDKNKMIVDPCPRCEEVLKLQGQLKELTDTGLDNKDARVALLNARIRSLNRGSYYYINVINVATGKMGDLKLPYSSFTLLEEAIKKHKSDKKKDPLSVADGVVFNFSRKKDEKNGKYSFTATVATENKVLDINGVSTNVNVDIDFPLTDEIIGRLKKETQSLDELITVITVDQIQDIVTRGVPAIDDVFKINQKKENPSPEADRGSGQQQETSAGADVDVRTPEQIAADNAAKAAADAQVVAKLAADNAAKLAAEAAANAAAEAAANAAANAAAEAVKAVAANVDTNIGDTSKETAGTTPAANADFASMSDEQFQAMIKGQ